MFRTPFSSRFASLLTLPLVACGSGTPAPAVSAGGTPAAEMANTPAPTAAVAPAVQAKASGALAEMRAFIDSKALDRSTPNWKTSLPMPPKLSFDPALEHYWLLDTNEGPIKIRLMPEVAPMHVSSTIFLTELGFYDGLSFHRVITGFMAQGGDPLGTGSGGPGYKYAGEFSPSVRHDKPGLLSMANAGAGTDGSQFFLTFVPTPHLNDKHTIFGEIVEGMDALRRLEQAGSPSGKTSKALSIQSAKILSE